MSDVVEIIDLTHSSPQLPPHELPDLDSEQPAVASASLSEPNTPTPDAQTRKKRKKRTKRSSMSANTGKDTDTPRESRAASVEEEQQVIAEARSKRKRKGDDEEPEPLEEGNEDNSRQMRRKEKKERRIEEKKNQKDEEKLEDLFFVDVAPAPISSTIISAPIAAESSTETTQSAKLLVPAHVTVLGSTPVEIILPLEEGEEEDEDFINYLDYDDTRHIVRYYDEAPDENIVLNRTVCKNCGAEGEHKTSACTIMICLTCGVRNEHSTRSCPISKVCFTCGMKGHINANCPNRRTARALQSSREIECDRCSSSNHKTNECPTVWRQYEYFTVEEQSQIIATRLSKKDLKVGQGGEGYVADDEWCYYCGQCGHWGDDCQDMERAPVEHSAFSQYNVASGPFYDPGHERKVSTSRARVRDWENGNGDEMSGWGKGAPDHVGRQGRMKSRAALEKQMREADEDQEDWFGGAAKRSNGASRNQNQNQNWGPASLPQKPATRGFVFGKGVGSERRYANPPPQNNQPPPRLLDRIGGEDRRESYDSRSRSNRDREHRRGHRDKDRDRDRDRDERRRYDDRSGSNHYSDRRRQDSGPRYRGGYIAR